jgi:hypothetical protein
MSIQFTIFSRLFDLQKAFKYFLLILILNHFAIYAETNDHLSEEKSLEPAGEESSLQPTSLFVSLGSSCTVALQLRLHGLRKQAFPFDWLLTADGDRLAELIGNNFKDFLNEKYLIKHPRVKNFLVHSYYHVEFRHDWSHGFWKPDQYSEALEQLKSKYSRRIERFKALNDFPGKVFFVRIDTPNALGRKSYWQSEKALKIDHASALTLKHALQHRFPNLNFTLVIINHNGDEEEMEIVDDIFFFNLSKFAGSERDNFNKIFQTLQRQVPNSSVNMEKEKASLMTKENQTGT